MRKLLPFLTLALGFTVFYPLVAAAQDAMTPPPVPDQVKKLWPYVGDFTGTGTWTMGTKTSTVQIRHVNTKISGGYGMQFLEDMTPTGSPAIHSEMLLAFDPDTKMIRIFSVGSDGTVMESHGTWKDPNTLYFKDTGTYHGKPYTEEFTWTAKGLNEYTLSGTSTMGKDQSSAFQATLKRTSATTLPGMPSK